MNPTQPSRLKKFGLWIAFLGTSCLIYLPVLGKKVTNPDANITYPQLFKIEGAGEYLKMLFHFQTVDFQPVRDLSFFIDFFLFRNLGAVTFTTTNVVLWAIVGFFLFKLIELSAPENKRKNLILWALAFTAYPLFSQIVPWGMARKHILAIMFLLWATLSFLRGNENSRGKIKIVVFYLLSVLSQPIGVFWPVWATAHLYLTDRRRLRDSKGFISLLFVTMVLVLVVNYNYYTTLNSTVREAFLDARPEWNILNIILNFFFYLRQIFLPYSLTFQNYPDFSNSWPGLLVLFLLFILIRKGKQDRFVLSWLIFSIFAFPVFIALPAVYDQYLLLPAIGIVLLFSRSFVLTKRPSIFLCCLLIFWGTLTFSHARLWARGKDLAFRNFENYPSCKSATSALSQYYAEGHHAPVEAVAFFIKSNCLHLPPGIPPYGRIRLIYVESMMLFHENEAFPESVRMERLQQLGKFHYFPELVYAAILSQQGRSEEVEAIAKEVEGQTNGEKLETGFIIDQVLRPYCVRNHLVSCLKVTEPAPPPYPYL